MLYSRLTIFDESLPYHLENNRAPILSLLRMHKICVEGEDKYLKRLLKVKKEMDIVDGDMKVPISWNEWLNIVEKTVRQKLRQRMRTFKKGERRTL